MTEPGSHALAYIRCSTEEQRDSGASLQAQRAALEGEGARRGWTLEFVEDAGVSGGIAPTARAGLGRALARLDAGEARVLLVGRLDRLGRNLADVATLLDRAQHKGWAVVTVDTSGLDMSTATGRLVAGVLASAAAFERDLIRQRTREGLAAKRSAGVRLGRPPRLPPETVQRVQELRAQGLSLRRIASSLDAEGFATANGGTWQASSISAVLTSQAATPTLKSVNPPDRDQETRVVRATEDRTVAHRDSGSARENDGDERE
ncbi:hypothetical protein acdb102_16050 [Acidothermaceae bacterium B102]|nr:hypothetical protein acdb102_16050 [Acidothermaceae bacterium B102]